MKFWIISILVLCLVSCKQDNIEYSRGVITGEDMRKCVCCGGYFIEIDKINYRFFSEEVTNNPLNLIDAHFPITVQVVWEKRNPSCLGDEIKISKMLLYIK